jgi:biotin/methionine sulfoxide reductase
MDRKLHPHSSHWGVFRAEVANGDVVRVHPYEHDPDPAPILGNIPGAMSHKARVKNPMVRAGWLERGPGADDLRGTEAFVEVTWEEVTTLLAAEFERVYGEYGAESVFGGSYGWSSAGRFHHAQGQLHRFLNCLGGYVASRNTYSNGALTPLMRHVVGSERDYLDKATSWEVIAEHTELFVSFGGVPLKNLSVNPGGIGQHTSQEQLRAAHHRGTSFVLVSPLRDDLSASLDAEWLPVVPGTDIALMLGLAHTLVTEGLADSTFLERYCAGYETFEAYLMGTDGGVPKSPEWAESICQIPAATLRSLARRMARSRTLVNVNYSLQRAHHGEQAPWMAVTLAAMLGQIGLPGGGFGQGYGSLPYVGRRSQYCGPSALPQGENPVEAFIPVARIADMLLAPGQTFDYDGLKLTYPDIKLVYWCGGNPFHHHQDLARLNRAFARPDTIIVNDPFWTPMARHADIVLPATLTLERDDFAASSFDSTVVAMHAVGAPHGEARDDYDIFAGLARVLGKEARFTEGRTSAEWVRHLYDDWRERRRNENRPALPPFDEFWELGILELDDRREPSVLYSDYRSDPTGFPRGTPSGKIEIYSETVASFGYNDCIGHPAWLPPAEWLGAAEAAEFPLCLIANNPKTRLHSQLDMGGYSQSSKVEGREPVRLNPADAKVRGVVDGAVVRLFNNKGSCLAGAVLDENVRPNVVQLSTGAWFDPLDPTDPDSMCIHGNPNVLTTDRGTSSLTQGCAGQHALVEVELWAGEVPTIRAYDPPRTTTPDA